MSRPRECQECGRRLSAQLYTEQDEVCNTCARKKQRSLHQTAMEDTVEEHVTPTSETDVDIDAFINQHEDDITRTLEDVAERHGAIRWYVAMNVLFHRQSEARMQETEGGFYTQTFTASNVVDIDLTELRRDLDGEVDRFTNAGSGWSVTVILRFIIRIGQYRSLTGSSFIPTPKALVGNYCERAQHR